jgi:adenine-specific DNA methylase
MRAERSANKSGGRLEARFDATFAAALALREKQVQQSYRPVIGIHKWFARRPGSLFRSLLLGEFVAGDTATEYWKPQRVSGIIADPFMGGGTTVFEALRLGFSVVGSDVNPMAYWLVRQAVEELDIAAFEAAGERVWKEVGAEIGALYETTCSDCGGGADVKYFFWVKTCSCPECGAETSLFPSYRVAEAVRHPSEVYYCPTCDSLIEIETGQHPRCVPCARDLSSGNVSRGTATCLDCDHAFRFARYIATPPRHRLIGMEYHCAGCFADRPGRQFKSPDAADHFRVEQAAAALQEREHGLLIPEDEIPSGDETDRLHRWGYRRYRDMFNERQLLALGLLLAEIKSVEEPRIRQALATVFSDFLRYQNLLCRYDTYALKCQDIFAVHGFPVGLVACENNVLGIPGVGSGSFVHFIAKYAKAKQYSQHPYETRRDGIRKRVVPMGPEQIEAPLVSEGPPFARHAAWLSCGPSQTLKLQPASLDGVFTDPPYYDNVQYAELMDFCFVWLRALLGDEIAAFRPASTRTEFELTGNETMSRGLEEFTQGISEVFSQVATALKPSAPLVFTYHHNEVTAYLPLVVGILDAGLTCTAVLPAPGEMAASLHIAGTRSSILDSVFVCRLPGAEVSDLGPIDDLVESDRAAMAAANYTCTGGDIQCLRAGHCAAAAIRGLVDGWDRTLPLAQRMELALHALAAAREVASV